MQKDALNNVHITDEQVLMTPEACNKKPRLLTRVKPFQILSPGAILVCW